MEAYFNRAEAGLWALIALVFFALAFRDPRAQRRTRLFLSLAFAAFSASDFLEARTGAWWQPWWLAALKGACVVAIFVGFRRAFVISGKPHAREKDHCEEKPPPS